MTIIFNPPTPHSLEEIIELSVFLICSNFQQLNNHPQKPNTKSGMISISPRLSHPSCCERIHRSWWNEQQRQFCRYQCWPQPLWNWHTWVCKKRSQWLLVGMFKNHWAKWKRKKKTLKLQQLDKRSQIKWKEISLWLRGNKVSYWCNGKPFWICHVF